MTGAWNCAQIAGTNSFLTDWGLVLAENSIAPFFRRLVVRGNEPASAEKSALSVAMKINQKNS
jgi:hypothetical protein